jgi:hypothetical protein
MDFDKKPTFWRKKEANEIFFKSPTRISILLDAHEEAHRHFPLQVKSTQE